MIPPDPKDEARVCDRCGATFVFTAGEQRFYAARGIPDAPRRCAPCRKALKLERRAIPHAPRVDDAPKSGPHCAWCGEPARVPFAVAAHRPVACEACYRWRLGATSGLRSGSLP